MVLLSASLDELAAQFIFAEWASMTILATAWQDNQLPIEAQLFPLSSGDKSLTNQAQRQSSG